MLIVLAIVLFTSYFGIKEIINTECHSQPLRLEKFKALKIFLISIPLFLASTVVFSFGFYLIVTKVSFPFSSHYNLFTGSLNPQGLVAIINGASISIMGLFWGIRKFLKDDLLVKDFWSYYNSFYGGSNIMGLLKAVSGFFIIAGIVVIPLAKNTFFKIGQTEIVTSGFLELTTHHYSYSELQEIRWVNEKYTIVENGPLNEKTYFEVVFTDGYTWEEPLRPSESNSALLKSLDYMSTLSGVKIDSVYRLEVD